MASSPSRAAVQILQKRVCTKGLQPQARPLSLPTPRLVIRLSRRANHTFRNSPLTGPCRTVRNSANSTPGTPSATPPPPLSLALALSYRPAPSSSAVRTVVAISPMAPVLTRRFNQLHTLPAEALPSSSSSSSSSSLSSPSALSSPPVGTSPAANIASRRSAQLARHFSSSPSSSFNPVLHTSISDLTKMASPYTTRKVAAPNTLEHRVYIEKDGVPVSPFHDIPLYANAERTILNMIVEIPRWTNAKLEISKDELLNPIKQDVKKGKLRFVRNCFPHKGYLWNYGAFPQTWEDPNSVHPETKAKGDNDPLDVCEIGELVGYTGQIKQVKVLGVMALLDEEETDWKVIVVDVKDPLASKLNDVEDVERHLPGLLRATNEWFRIYKIPDGKPENQFAFTGECKNKAYAMDVIHECGEAWEKLITGKTASGGISTTNLTVSQSPSRVTPDQLPPIPPNENLAPEPIDSSIDKWFFISGAAN
ncbi:inorganic pyrophosphatase [Xylaria bambusicola]|uniref:inorganic pyrophosphatase n=1 Tax=Xylaria bambusicola TaxID=326684 RepID=UPI00200861DC|nr:inorganic pyrophosphatase [Xylaria bambusicola]KAI0526056.1 inorganic pyrophosphatase [Xylaria bambusicola]